MEAVTVVQLIVTGLAACAAVAAAVAAWRGPIEAAKLTISVQEKEQIRNKK